jgi:RNA polymerase sigma-70 factor (ECF subfamily)
MENYPAVVRYLRHQGVPTRDLDDVAQEVFVIAYGRFHVYDPSRSVRRWVIGFAVNCARVHKRRSARPTNALGASADFIDPPHPGAPVDDGIASRDIIRRGLAALSDEQREVFVLHELLEFSVPEVAEIMGILLNTAYSRLRLARANFVRAVRATEEAPDV